MKKKFLPVALVIFTFSGFLVGQIVLDLTSSNASRSTPESEANVHFAQQFKSLRVKTTKEKLIVMDKIKSPVVIINFWAEWCKPCLEEFPSLVELRKKYSEDQVYILGINSDEENQLGKIQKVEDKFQLNFQSVADKENEILIRFQVPALPYTLVFVNGKIEKKITGRYPFMGDELKEIIEKAL